MCACKEGRAREVEGGEGFGRRGCEAAIIGGMRGRAGRAGRPGCAWNERPQMKLRQQQRISGLDRRSNFGHETLAMARVLSPRGGFGAELSSKAIFFGFRVDFLWVSLLQFSLGFVWEGFVAARGGFSAILFAAGRVRSWQFARVWRGCHRRREGSAPNSLPARNFFAFGEVRPTAHFLRSPEIFLYVNLALNESFRSDIKVGVWWFYLPCIQITFIFCVKL